MNPDNNSNDPAASPNPLPAPIQSAPTSQDPNLVQPQVQPSPQTPFTQPPMPSSSDWNAAVQAPEPLANPFAPADQVTQPPAFQPGTPATPPALNPAPPSPDFAQPAAPSLGEPIPTWTPTGVPAAPVDSPLAEQPQVAPPQPTFASPLVPDQAPPSPSMAMGQSGGWNYPSELQAANNMESAPTDLSQLVGNVAPSLSIPQTSITPTENLIVSTPAAPGDVSQVVANNPSKGFPKWIFAVGGLVLLLVVGISAYFILGIGQTTPSTFEETTSLPAEEQIVEEQTLTNPPQVAPVIPAEEPATATSSPEISPTTPAGSSSIDRLRQRQTTP